MYHHELRSCCWETEFTDFLLITRIKVEQHNGAFTTLAKWLNSESLIAGQSYIT